MSNFKDIEKGKFFQDNDYYQFNRKHCYLKTGTYQYLDVNTGKYVDVRKKYDEEAICGDYSYRFRTVEVDIQVRGGIR